MFSLSAGVGAIATSPITRHTLDLPRNLLLLKLIRRRKGSKHYSLPKDTNVELTDNIVVVPPCFTQPPLSCRGILAFSRYPLSYFSKFSLLISYQSLPSQLDVQPSSLCYYKRKKNQPTKTSRIILQTFQNSFTSIWLSKRRPSARHSKLSYRPIVGFRENT